MATRAICLILALVALTVANPFSSSLGAALLERSSPGRSNHHARGTCTTNCVANPSYYCTSSEFCYTGDGCCYLLSPEETCNYDCLTGYSCATDGLCYPDATYPTTSAYVPDTSTSSYVPDTSTSSYEPYTSTSSYEPSYTPDDYDHDRDTGRKSGGGSSRPVHGKAKIPPKAIGGIVVGVVVGIAGLVAAILLCCRRLKKKQNPTPVPHGIPTHETGILPSPTPLHGIPTHDTGILPSMVYEKEAEGHVSPIASPSPVYASTPMAPHMSSRPSPPPPAFDHISPSGPVSQSPPPHSSSFSPPLPEGRPHFAPQPDFHATPDQPFHYAPIETDHHIQS